MLLKDSALEQMPWVLLISAKKALFDKTVRLWIISVLVLFAIVFGAFDLGVSLQKQGYIGDTLLPFVKRNTIYLPKRVKAILSRPEFEHLTIDLKHTNFMKLAYKREVAMANDILVKSSEDYVNADIRYKDKTYKVKLRLKGDEVEHLGENKWSFRINLKGGDTLFGMKVFSIHHPKTRNYIYEWILHKALQREDLIHHRYEFVQVTVNGEDWGIYALEEHVEKRLIENSRRREGPIISFNENIQWAEFVQQWREFRSFRAWNGSGAYTSSDIQPFQMQRWTADSTSREQLIKAISLLESFRRGKLSTSQAFDVKKLATYYAVMDLMGAFNGNHWTNMRFYYNPVTSLLEPIGRDGVPGRIKQLSVTRNLTPRKIDTRDGLITNQWEIFFELYYAHLFDDRAFFNTYIKELERLSQPSYLDDFFSAINDELEKNLSILYSEFPEFSFSRDILYENQRYIQTVLNPAKGLHAYYHKALPDRVQLELGNIQSLPVEVLSVTYKDSMLLRPSREIILPAKVPSDPVKYQNENFEFSKGFSWSDTLINYLTVNYRVLGTSRLRQETIFPWPYVVDNLIDHDFIRQQPNVNQFNFIVVDESMRELLIKPGVWHLDKSLIIPKGYKVRCGEGTQLNLTNSAMIFSRSPLEFIGSEENPIVIQSSDSTGQGLTVLSAGETSVVSQVTFKNLTNPSKNGWELTGAVTFYESPVQIFQSQFIGNRSEDALNIVRSEFTIDETLFRQTSADAFDADFTKGKITNSSFVACGNDAIDISGSEVDIQDVFIDDPGDKGLSNGEESHMTARNIDIRNAEIAVASKDISQMILENIKISGGRLGFTAYQKKSEFGPASITVDGLTMTNVEVPYLIEERSTMMVDKVTIPANRQKVADILYGVEYGKSSK